MPVAGATTTQQVLLVQRQELLKQQAGLLRSYILAGKALPVRLSMMHVCAGRDVGTMETRQHAREELLHKCPIVPAGSCGH